jgi:hypothetical protein
MCYLSILHQKITFEKNCAGFPWIQLVKWSKLFNPTIFGTHTCVHIYTFLCVHCTHGAHTHKAKEGRRRRRKRRRRQLLQETWKIKLFYKIDLSTFERENKKSSFPSTSQGNETAAPLCVHAQRRRRSGASRRWQQKLFISDDGPRKKRHPRPLYTCMCEHIYTFAPSVVVGCCLLLFAGNTDEDKRRCFLAKCYWQMTHFLCATWSSRVKLIRFADHPMRYRIIIF